MHDPLWRDVLDQRMFFQNFDSMQRFTFVQKNNIKITREIARRVRSFNDCPIFYLKLEAKSEFLCLIVDKNQPNLAIVESGL